MAEGLERATPAEVVSSMKKALRKGKVFIDWSQNDDHKTTVNVYSLRAKERPTVSTPLTWDEVEAGSSARGAARLVFGPEDVLRRIRRHGDLFAPVLALRQRLPSLKALDAALKGAPAGSRKAAPRRKTAGKAPKTGRRAQARAARS